MSTTSVHHAVDRVERELARLRAARPAMAARIDKAEALLVAHLSAPSPASRPIRVRVHADGGRSYTVRSGSKLSKSYTVDGFTFGCPCPATVPCYHALACYVLDRVLYGPAEPVAAATKRATAIKRPAEAISAGLARMAS